MEIEKRDKDKMHKMFCEKHRPLKIVKEMEEKDKITVEEIHRFCKVIEKCMEVDKRAKIRQMLYGKEEKSSSGKGRKDS